MGVYLYWALTADSYVTQFHTSACQISLSNWFTIRDSQSTNCQVNAWHQLWTSLDVTDYQQTANSIPSLDGAPVTHVTWRVHVTCVTGAPVRHVTWRVHVTCLTGAPVTRHMAGPCDGSRWRPSETCHMAGPCVKWRVLSNAVCQSANSRVLDGSPHHKCRNLSQPLATEWTVDLGQKGEQRPSHLNTIRWQYYC